MWRALVVVIFLAGCIQAPEAGLSLSDLTQCSFTYPDGTPIPCETTMGRLDAGGPAPGVTEGWFCTEGSPGHWHYSHLDGRWGLYYFDWGLPGPVQPVLHARSADGRDLAAWTWLDDDGAGFVELPPMPDGATGWALWRYTVSIESDTPRLQDAQATIVWSEYNGTSYPLIRVDAEGGPYWFHTVLQWTVGDRPTRYYPAEAHLVGADFELKFLAVDDNGYGWSAVSGPIDPCTFA